MKRAGLVVFLLFLIAPFAWAQSGKLSGRITDINGEPLPGATAQIEGTLLGNAADRDGDYNILRIPPGTYRVRFSYVGFQTQIVEGVLIASNQTATLDIRLREEVFAGEEVLVTAERPIVDVSLTNSVQTISRDQIAILPVQSLNDVVNLQAGVVDGHFRGGRLGEVQYQVNGVSVNNPYDNRASVQLDRSVLQEVQVISGTFDAEYGQAMSGVVNAVLRTGDPGVYELSFETLFGDYFSPGDDSTTVISRFDGPLRVPLYPDVSRLSPLARQNYQASLSGPVPFVPNTTFLVNGQRLIDRGYLFAERRFVPTDSSNFERGEFMPTGDGAMVPMSFNNRWGFLGKVSNRSIRNVQLSYQAIGGIGERRGYQHAWRFNPDGTKSARDFSLVHGIDMAHTLSPDMFYEVNLRQNYYDYRDMKYDDVRDPRYFEAGDPRSSANYNFGAIVQGVDLGRFVQRTNQWVGKASFTWQMNKANLLKIGAEYQPSVVEFGVPGRIDRVILDGRQQLAVVEDTLGAEVLRYTPVSASFFAQDRIEIGDIRVRIGVRAEYFDARAYLPGDLANPANAIAGAPEADPVRTTAKIVLAPRLGFSFPILTTASLYFSYGHFYQMPGLGQIFSNSDYSVLRDLQRADQVSYGVMGNPDLRPEFTAQYEFGFKSEITAALGVDLNLFYKDIRDLLGVEFVQTYTAAEYARFTNVDFGGVRGFTLSVDYRGESPLSVSLDYTFQEAAGNSSDPRETANRAAAGADPRPRQVPFNWDQPHTLNGMIIFNPGSFNVTAIGRFSSGQPYTPSIGTTFGANLETNSGRKPTSFVLDLRAERSFSVAGMQVSAFVRGFNVLGSTFSNGFVYSDTGSNLYTLSPQAQQNPDPTRLAAPRRIEFGLLFNARQAVRR